MKYNVLLGLCFALVACQSAPQEELERIGSEIATYEEAGAGDELPEVFNQIKTSYEGIVHRVEMEQKNTFKNFNEVNRELRLLSIRLDSVAMVIVDRAEMFKQLMQQYQVEGAMGFLLLKKLEVKKTHEALVNKLKKEVMMPHDAFKMQQQLMKAKSLEMKNNLIIPVLDSAERLNNKIKEFLTDEEYQECVNRVKQQQSVSGGQPLR